MKAYYAHCQSLYNTKQEIRDLEFIDQIGLEVENPNSPEVEAALVGLSREECMAWFERFADSCDLIVFRGLPGGAITSGVMREINWFRDRQKPVIELPTFAQRQTLTVEETRTYLREVGKR